MTRATRMREEKANAAWRQWRCKRGGSPGGWRASGRGSSLDRGMAQTDGHVAVAVPIAAQDASNEQQLSDWQVSGTCVWRISDGTLEIAPAPGQAEGTLEGSSEDGPGGFDWLRYANGIRSAIVRPGVKTPTCMGMVAGCTQLVQVDLCGLDAFAATSFEGMFSECSKLASVDLSMLDGSKADDVSGMFSDCASLESVDLSGLAGSSPRKMDNMFANCPLLSFVDLSDVDGANIASMEGMFNSCTSLESVLLPDLSKSTATNAAEMFFGCSSLKGGLTSLVRACRCSPIWRACSANAPASSPSTSLAWAPPSSRT